MRRVCGVVFEAVYDSNFELFIDMDKCISCNLDVCLPLYTLLVHILWRQKKILKKKATGFYTLHHVKYTQV